MNKQLQDYSHLGGFGHRVDLTSLRDRLDNWTVNDGFFDRELMAEKLNRVESTLDAIEQEEFSKSRAFPSYDNILTQRNTSIGIFDGDGGTAEDPIQVIFNGVVLANNLIAPSNGITVDLSLEPDANELTIRSLGNPNEYPSVWRIEFDDNLYGDQTRVIQLSGGQDRTWEVGLPIITIDGNETPEASKHLGDFLNFRPSESIWRLSRDNRDIVDQRRDNSQSLYRVIEGTDPVRRISGFDLDEVPFASTEEEGSAAFVRPIPFRDNQDAGIDYRVQINGYGPEKKRLPDGTDIQIEAINTFNSRAIVGQADINERIGGRGGIDYIYALSGDDYIEGFGGNDVIFGNGGLDIILGDSGNDDLYGNEGRDLLVGGLGRDDLVGGIGSDILYGGDIRFDIITPEPDIFLLQRPARYRGDLVADFEPGIDRIGLLKSDFQNLDGFSFVNGTLQNFTGAWIQWNGTDMMFLENQTASGLNNGIFWYYPT